MSYLYNNTMILLAVDRKNIKNFLFASRGSNILIV